MAFLTFHTPVGFVGLRGDDALEEITFAPLGQSPVIPPLLAEARNQLEAYFSGRLRRFDLPIRFTRGTPFQQQVWTALSDIPFGEAISYAELSQRINRPKSFRAVGQACSRNPIPIILPCHRVLGANGALTGFSGGLEIKAALLRLEQNLLV